MGQLEWRHSTAATGAGDGHSGRPDIGLGAEDVAEVAPSFTFRNGKGEIDGVRYDRLNIILINAIKEQQTQIEKQQEQLEQQRQQIEELRKQVSHMRASAHRKGPPSQTKRT